MVKVDLLPCHAGHLIAPLSGEDEKLEQRTERPTLSNSSVPHRPEFIIREHAVTTRFPTGSLDAGRRRMVDGSTILSQWAWIG